MNKEKTIVITGANSGLGLECSRHIANASKDYKIILACRDLTRAEEAKSEILKKTGSENIVCMELDLSSLKSIRKFANSLISAGHKPLYGLVCNAGIRGNDDKRTEDGFDMTFGVNHLGHFLLVNLLLPYLDDYGRIAVVSSDMHNPPGGIIWPGVMALAHTPENFHLNKYSLSKLCNLYFVYELAKDMELKRRHITVNAFNPGLMTDTNFFPDQNMFSETFLASVSDRIGSLENSSKVLSDMVTESIYGNISGRFIDRGKDIKSSVLSYNEANAKELWAASKVFVNL